MSLPGEYLPPTVEPLALTLVKLHLRVTASDEDDLIAACIAAARDFVEEYTGIALVARPFETTLDVFPASIELPVWPVRSVVQVAYTDADGVDQVLETASWQLDKRSRPGWVKPAYDTDWPETLPNINAVRVRYMAGLLMPVTFSAAADTATAAYHGFATDDPVPYTTHGTAAGGLTKGGNYYARAVTDSTFKLSETAGGGTLDLTTAGSGAQFVGALDPKIVYAMLLIIGHYFEHREWISDFAAHEVPQSVPALLDGLRLMRI